MSIENKNTFEYNKNEKLNNKNSNQSETQEQLLNNLWKKVWETERKKLQEELSKIDIEKDSEISEFLSNHKFVHKSFQTEVILSSELPKKIDYSNSEHVKKITQIALLKQAQKERDVA